MMFANHCVVRFNGCVSYNARVNAQQEYSNICILKLNVYEYMRYRKDNLKPISCLNRNLK